VSCLLAQRALSHLSRRFSESSSEVKVTSLVSQVVRVETQEVRVDWRIVASFCQRSCNSVVVRFFILMVIGILNNTLPASIKFGRRECSTVRSKPLLVAEWQPKERVWG
jgi:hypothetical protein